jgi:cell division protease FtsH
MAVKDDKPRFPGNIPIGSLLFWLGGLLLIVNIFLPGFFGNNIPQVPYSLFIDQVEDGNVNQVYIGQDQIRYQLKNEAGTDEPGQVLSTTPIFDLDLPKRLEDKGVQFAAAPPPRNTWFTTLLSWVIPPLIFVGIWIGVGRFLQNRGGGIGGPQGALSITKSRAKVYVENEATKVTFKDVAGVEEAKTELEEVVEFLKEPQRYIKIGARIPSRCVVSRATWNGENLTGQSRCRRSRSGFL